MSRRITLNWVGLFGGLSRKEYAKAVALGSLLLASGCNFHT